MQTRLSGRVAEIQESQTTRLTSIVGAMKASGENIYDLSVGEPDFQTPSNIVEAAELAMKKGFTKYTEVSGIKPLREAIAEKLRQDNKLDYAPSQIVVCNGAKQAIFNTLQVICKPGDEVILPSPFWVSLKSQIELAGGKPVTVPAKQDSGDLDADAISSAVSEKTKAIIVNSPNNPTGAVYSKRALAALAELAMDKNLFMISDEVYEKFVYGEGVHTSIGTLNEDAMNLTLTVNSFSKTYCMTGWRIGYLAAPPEIAEAVKKLQSHSSGNVSTIAQHAAIEALRGPQDSVAKLVKEFSKRRKILLGILDGILPFISPKGAFYLFPDVSALLQKGESSISLCESLLKNDKIALVPGEAFGAEDHIRISYAAPIESIEAAAERLVALAGGK